MSAKSGAIICKFVIVYDNFILGKFLVKKNVKK